MSLGADASASRALASVRGRFHAGAGAAAARDAYVEALQHYTQKLDDEYPGDDSMQGLKDVRAALNARRERWQGQDGRQISSGANVLVLDEKAIEYCGLSARRYSPPSATARAPSPRAARARTRRRYC